MTARLRTARRTVLAGVAAGGLAACTPGSSGSSSSPSTSSHPVSTGVASLGGTTPTAWDQDLAAGVDAAQKKLDDRVTVMDPNVEVERVARSFADFKTTLELAPSGDDAPDVVQAKLLRPVDPWDDLHGWTEDLPTDLLSLGSSSPGGKTWRTAPLGLASSRGEHATQTRLLAAAATIVAVPSVLLHLFGQRRSTARMPSGAVEG